MSVMQVSVEQTSDRIAVRVASQGEAGYLDVVARRYQLKAGIECFVSVHLKIPQTLDSLSEIWSLASWLGMAGATLVTLRHLIRSEADFGKRWAARLEGDEVRIEEVR